MRRQIEFVDKSGNSRSFSYEISGNIEYIPNVNLEYMDDTTFLFDPTNGFIDENGNATDKLANKLRYIERINEGTWEFVISDISYLDKRPLRGGGTRAIPTYYDISGSLSGLITGVGDNEDCKIQRIDYERQPDIMSKDLFISTMDGFTIGTSQGKTNEIEYTSILNPVNESNVNNYYPVLNHGWFYSGATEYYMYGNKQTEIILGESAIWDISGMAHYILSGFPNIISPIMLNLQGVAMQQLLSNMDISDYSVFAHNSYRKEFSSSRLTVKHELSTLYPWVYVVTEESKEIVMPSVEIQTLNQIVVTFPTTVTGHINVIRPNKYFRTFEVAHPDGLIITHGLNSTELFVLINSQEDLGVPTTTILDENRISVTAPAAAGTLYIMDIQHYTFSEELVGFTSGIITHNLGLELEGESDFYVDPWVFSITDSHEIVVGDAQLIDANRIYVSFGDAIFTGNIYILDFKKFNEAGAIYDGTSKINTDLFAFQEGEYYGNLGLATPFHQISHLPPNQYEVPCQDRLEVIRELDFQTGYYQTSGTIDAPLYITTTNEIIVPSGLLVTPSGTLANLIVTYEKEKSDAYEFRFRGTDISPVTWYNTDRVIAIQPEQDDPAIIQIIPDENNIHLQNSATRSVNGVVNTQVLSHVIGNVVDGEPTTKMSVIVFVTDFVGVASSGEVVSISTVRPLYQGSDLTPIENYNIRIVDNTSGLFGLPVEVINTELSGMTISTPSIFDEVILDVVPTSEERIYDDNGYLFTTIPQISSYRIPFRGSLYDDENDELTHIQYKSTDVFGTCKSILAFHNDNKITTISKLIVSSQISGDTNVSAYIPIFIHPISGSSSYGMVDNQDVNNLYGLTQDIYNDTVEIIDEHIPSVSTIRIVEQEEFHAASGIVFRSAGTTDDIIDVFTMDDGYVVYHTSGATGNVLRYDVTECSPVLLDIGESYGNN